MGNNNWVCLLRYEAQWLPYSSTPWPLHIKDSVIICHRIFRFCNLCSSLWFCSSLLSPLHMYDVYIHPLVVLLLYLPRRKRSPIVFIHYLYWQLRKRSQIVFIRFDLHIKITVALHNGTSYWEGGNRAAGFAIHLFYSKKLNRRRRRLWRCASYGENLDYCWQTRLVSGKCDNAEHTCPSLIGYCLNHPSSGSSPAHGKNQPKSRERYTHSLTGSEILILSSLSASVSGFDGLREADYNKREPPPPKLFSFFPQFVLYYRLFVAQWQICL